MQIGSTKDERLQSEDPTLIGAATRDQFAQTHAALQAWTDREHDDEGRHTDITAQSITAKTATIETLKTTASFTSPINIGTPKDPVDLAGPVLSGGVTDYNDGPPPAVVVTTDEARACLVTDRDFLPSLDGKFNLGLEGTGSLLRRWKGLVVSATVRAKDVWASNRFWEANRTAALGYWQTVPYAQANFLADGAANVWVVDAVDHVRYAYTLIGKTIIISFEINATSLSVAATRLQIKLPAGLNWLAASDGVFTYFGPGVNGTGTIETTAGATLFSLLRDIGGAAWPVSTNALYVRGQFAGEVQ